MIDPIAKAAAHATGELGRGDDKANTVLGIAGAGLAGLGAAEYVFLTTPTPWTAACGAGVALLLAFGAVDRALRAVAPNLSGNHGITAYAKAGGDAEVVRLAVANQDSEVLWWTAKAAVAKYQRVGEAIRLLRAALYVTAATAVVTVVVAVAG